MQNNTIESSLWSQYQNASLFVVHGCASNNRSSENKVGLGVWLHNVELETVTDEKKDLAE